MTDVLDKYPLAQKAAHALFDRFATMDASETENNRQHLRALLAACDVIDSDTNLRPSEKQDVMAALLLMQDDGLSLEDDIRIEAEYGAGPIRVMLENEDDDGNPGPFTAIMYAAFAIARNDVMLDLHREGRLPLPPAEMYRELMTGENIPVDILPPRLKSRYQGSRLALQCALAPAGGDPKGPRP